MTALVLFPGAGADRDSPALVAIEAALPDVHCVRADFPYRREGRRAPDRPTVLLQAVRDEAARFAADRLFLGGRSMGGRICSMAVADADDPVAAAGLVLVAYPLHPPGKPQNLRVEHFPRISVPCLFVSGTKDAFGAPDELERWTSTIPAPVTHVWIDGKGHDLRGADAEVARVVAGWIRSAPSPTARRPRRPRGSGPRARGARSPDTSRG